MNPAANITAVKAVSFTDFDPEDTRGVERALKEGIKFSHKNAQILIRLMKENGMLREVHTDEDKQAILDQLDNILKNIRR